MSEVEALWALMKRNISLNVYGLWRRPKKIDVNKAVKQLRAICETLEGKWHDSRGPKR